MQTGWSFIILIEPFCFPSDIGRHFGGKSSVFENSQKRTWRTPVRNVLLRLRGTTGVLKHPVKVKLTHTHIAFCFFSDHHLCIRTMPIYPKSSSTVQKNKCVEQSHRPPNLTAGLSAHPTQSETDYYLWRLSPHWHGLARRYMPFIKSNHR